MEKINIYCKYAKEATLYNIQEASIYFSKNRPEGSKYGIQTIVARLSINHLSLEDSGTYKIKVENEKGSDVKSCDVDVEIPEKIIWPKFQKSGLVGFSTSWS